MAGMRFQQFQAVSGWQATDVASTTRKTQISGIE
jgi:hypothetical protein